MSRPSRFLKDGKAMLQTMPQVGSINGNHGLDLLACLGLVRIRHGHQGLDNLGTAGKSDNAQPVILVHGLDDGVGSVSDQIQDGQPRVLAVSWRGGRGAHAAGDVYHEDNVAWDVFDFSIWARRWLDLNEQRVSGWNGVEGKFRGLVGEGVEGCWAQGEVGGGGRQVLAIFLTVYLFVI